MAPSNGNCGVSLFSSTNFTGVTQTEKVKVQSGCCERSAGCGHFVERAGIAGGGMEGRKFGKERTGTASGQNKPKCKAVVGWNTSRFGNAQHRS